MFAQSTLSSPLKRYLRITIEPLSEQQLLPSNLAIVTTTPHGALEIHEDHHPPRDRHSVLPAGANRRWVRPYVRATYRGLTTIQVMGFTLLLLLQIRSIWSVASSLGTYDRDVRLTLTWSQLNDVLSLCVGLWAVKVANEKPSSKMYTYGVCAYFLSHMVAN